MSIRCGAVLVWHVKSSTVDVTANTPPPRSHKLTILSAAHI